MPGAVQVYLLPHHGPSRGLQASLAPQCTHRLQHQQHLPSFQWPVGIRSCVHANWHSQGAGACTSARPFAVILFVCLLFTRFPLLSALMQTSGEMTARKKIAGAHISRRAGGSTFLSCTCGRKDRQTRLGDKKSKLLAQSKSSFSPEEERPKASM